MSLPPTLHPDEELEVVSEMLKVKQNNIFQFFQVGEDTLSDIGASSLAGSSVSR